MKVIFNVDNISLMTEYIMEKILNRENIILFVNNKTNYLECMDMENFKFDDEESVILRIDEGFDWFDFRDCGSCINLRKEDEQLCNDCTYDSIWEHLFLNCKTK